MSIRQVTVEVVGPDSKNIDVHGEAFHRHFAEPETKTLRVLISNDEAVYIPWDRIVMVHDEGRAAT